MEARQGHEGGTEAGQDDAGGEDELGRIAALLADAAGIGPFMLESDPHGLARRQRSARRGEDEEMAPVVGLVRVVVEGPGQLLPVGAPVSKTSRSGLSVSLMTLERPASVVTAPLGEQVEVERDVTEAGDPGVAVGRQVLPPVVLFLFLGGAALASPADFNASQIPATSGTIAQGASRRAVRAGHGRRAQPMHDPRGVRLAAAVETDREDGEEDGQADRRDRLSTRALRSSSSTLMSLASDGLHIGQLPTQLI